MAGIDNLLHVLSTNTMNEYDVRQLVESYADRKTLQGQLRQLLLNNHPDKKKGTQDVDIKTMIENTIKIRDYMRNAKNTITTDCAAFNETLENFLNSMKGHKSSRIYNKRKAVWENISRGRKVLVKEQTGEDGHPSIVRHELTVYEYGYQCISAAHYGNIIITNMELEEWFKKKGLDERFTTSFYQKAFIKHLLLDQIGDNEVVPFNYKLDWEYLETESFQKLLVHSYFWGFMPQHVYTAVKESKVVKDIKHGDVFIFLDPEVPKGLLVIFGDETVSQKYRVEKHKLDSTIKYLTDR